jgi:hypothetical protein
LHVDNFSNISMDSYGNHFDQESVDGIGEYQTKSAFHNNLEESISLIERTAKKILPIYQELQKRIIPIRNIKKDRSLL